MSNLKNHYFTNVVPKLLEEFKYENVHQIPKLEKIQISSGLGLNAQNRVFLQKAIEEIRIITGQQPIVTNSKKSIAGFKIRQGIPLGLTVTLRREKMYSFLERFTKLVLPRIRDFRGLNSKNFDKYGNYNVGISDQLVFPDIDFDSVDQKRGFNINIVTSAKNPAEGFFLLKELGVPFAIRENNEIVNREKIKND
jgi:large subunit ribosomal protein L5